MTGEKTSGAVRPEDLLPAGVDSGTINGLEVRKGSVAAFLANVRLLDTVKPGTKAAIAVEEQLRALVPTLRAIGLLEVFTPKDPRIAKILEIS